MTTRSLFALTAGLAVVLATTTMLPAHGGRYRGPRDIVPPGAKPHTPPNGAPTPPGPITPPGTPPGPRQPVPSGPPTGVPTPPGNPPGPGGGGKGPVTPAGFMVQTDFGQWDFWWEFNKDPYLNIKDSLYHAAPVTGDDAYYMGRHKRSEGRLTTKPSESDIQSRILPALKRALESTNNNDITTGCLVALAKIGEHRSVFALMPVLQPYLRSNSQEIRETAALTMGIAGMPGAVRLLVDLATDTATGRKAVGHAQVDDRTRSFAIYGLGLIAFGKADIDLKQTVYDACAGILGQKKVADRNVAIAAILSIGLLNLQKDDASGKAANLRGEAIATLNGFYDRKLGRGAELIQSHVLTTVAKLLGKGSSPAHQESKKKFIAALTKRSGGKRSMDVQRAAVLGLGKLTDGSHADDELVSIALRKYFDGGRDAQAKSFALMSLAEIGGGKNQAFLLRVLKSGRKFMERPWAAIALGTLAFEYHRTHDRVDVTIGDELLKAMRKARTPYQRSAIAVALGLCRYQAAGGELLKMLHSSKHQDDLAGYLCIGLALMQYQKAVVPIKALVHRSLRRPELLKQAATALGKLGDRELTAMLVDMMRGRDQNLAKISAVASALSFIGDRNSIAPLIGLLQNDEMPDLSRAFAAAALGGVADKEKLPWNSKIARGLNYRAAVETLTQSGSGILDIL